MVKIGNKGTWKVKLGLKHVKRLDILEHLPVRGGTISEGSNECRVNGRGRVYSMIGWKPYVGEIMKIRLKVSLRGDLSFVETDVEGCNIVCLLCP